MKITELVEALLMKYPNTRDSDKDLLIGVYQALGANLSPHQREIIRSVSSESIRRHRQLLQAEGKYTASPDVLKQRKAKAYLTRQLAVSSSNHVPNVIADPVPHWAQDVIDGTIPTLNL